MAEKWRDTYKRRLVSIEDAAKVIKSGDTLYTGLGLGEPSLKLVNAIVARRSELRGVKVFSNVQVRDYPWYHPGLEESFELGTGFSTRPFWPVMRERRGTFLPMSTLSSGLIFERGWFPVDVFIAMVSPPRHGYVNLGLTNFYSMEALLAAKTVIAEVNEEMPVIYGDNWIHVSEIDYFVENTEPLPVTSRPEPAEIEKTIASYVLELIKDGDTLQMGIGGVPEAILRGLSGKRDLGVLTEMLPAGLPRLVEEGIVTNRNKPVHVGKSIGTFCLGDREMYDFVNENPAVEFYPARYTNSIDLISRHENMIAINGAVEVDLRGQVCAESIGPRHLSGIGGQLDFFIGACLAKYGRAVNVLPSTRKTSSGERVSCIVPMLQTGAGVTVPNAYTQFVVTEYGIASLRGKTVRQRAAELISVAHPDFRADLRREAARLY